MTIINSVTELSPRETRLAQRRFSFFSALNVVAFQLLSGNIITLYALRLGAGNFLIGLLYSFVPVAQIMPLIGRGVVRRLGAVRTFSLFFLLRYLMMIPVLFAPIFAGRNPGVGIVLIMVSVIGFNLSRGIGITGHNPVIAGITSERDRGAFLARNQLIVHAGAILTGVAMAFLLGEDSALYTYSLLIGTGILTGVLSSTVVARLPEPSVDRLGARKPIFATLRPALRRKGFGRFLVLLGIKSFVVSMIVPFLVVYMKRAYGQPDNLVILFTVAGSAGAIVMALVSGFAIDTVGPKPVATLFAALLILALLPVAAAPLISGTLFWVFAVGVFFLAHMGASGMENALSMYFFAVIRQDEALDLSIVNFLIGGTAATTGSLVAGAALDSLQGVFGLTDGFRIFYVVLAAAMVGILVIIGNLERTGPFSVREALAVLLSPRDLHAVSLLNRLRKRPARRAAEQQGLIRALGQTRSRVPTADLIRQLSSPRFAVRAEALSALAFVRADDGVPEALIAEVESEPFTTAYIAADLLGNRGYRQGVPALRAALDSRDFFLGGKAMVSLARLGDRESIPRIEELLAKTRNPRVIIHAATALEILKSPTSVAVLVAKLGGRLSGFVRDELNLALAVILGMEEFYYPLYVSFLEKRTLGVAALKDQVAELTAAGRKPIIPAEELTTLAGMVLEDEETFAAAAARHLADLPVMAGGEDVHQSLAAGARLAELGRASRFRFLIAAVIVRTAFGIGPSERR